MESLDLELRASGPGADAGQEVAGLVGVDRPEVGPRGDPGERGGQRSGREPEGEASLTQEDQAIEAVGPTEAVAQDPDFLQDGVGGRVGFVQDQGPAPPVGGLLAELVGDGEAEVAHRAGPRQPEPVADRPEHRRRINRRREVQEQGEPARGQEAPEPGLADPGLARDEDRPRPRVERGPAGGEHRGPAG